MPRRRSTRRSVLAAAALVLLAAAPAQGARPTLRDLSPDEGVVLAGDSAFVARGYALQAWPAAGGGVGTVAGFARPVDLLAGGPQTLLLWRDGELLAGPPQGPFTAAAPCERAVRVGAVDGRRIAYVRQAGCGGPAAIVVRDLAAAGAVTATVPLDATDDVEALALGTAHVAYSLVTGQGTRMPVRVDLATGARTRAFARTSAWSLAMSADGTLVAGRAAATSTAQRCPGRLSGLRALEPDLTVTNLDLAACGEAVALADGRLTFTRPYGDGFAELESGPLGGPYRPVARIAGRLVAADGTRALVSDATCWGTEAVHPVALTARPAAGEPGPGRCPVRLTARRAGRTVTVALRCPRGCDAQVGFSGPGGPSRGVALRPGGHRTVRLRFRGRGAAPLEVRAEHRTGPVTVWKRRIG